MQIEIIESIANSVQHYAVTVDGQCNHGGEMIWEDVEDDNSHRVERIPFCDRCGAQYNPFDNEWIENLSSRSHVAVWTRWILHGGEMPSFDLGQPIVDNVTSEVLYGSTPIN